jgi:hypothetical protein
MGSLTRYSIIKIKFTQWLINCGDTRNDRQRRLVVVFKLNLMKSLFSAPELVCIIAIAEILRTFSLNNSLLSIGPDFEVARNGSVGTPALSSFQMPGISDHQLKVVVSFNACTDICVVFLELV